MKIAAETRSSKSDLRGDQRATGRANIGAVAEYILGVWRGWEKHVGGSS